MLLIFIISVLCCYPINARPQPLPPSEPAWRQSRYIIDNRRNILFSGKPATPLLLHPGEESGTKVADRTPFPPDGCQKDLAAEASIAEPSYDPKYGDNSLPRKIIKSYKVGGALRPDEFRYKFKGFENRKNSSGVGYDPQNSIQNDEEVLKFGDLEETEDVPATTEKVWRPKFEGNVLVSVSSSTATSSREPPGEAGGPERPGGLEAEEREFGTSPTTSFPWKFPRKPEDGNQIDAGEKHVYETRIETVSYHQEVIFNPPKKEDWYRGEDHREEPEKNYEEPERNYEEPEKNYEADEEHGLGARGGGGDPEEEEENNNKFGYVVEGRNFRKYRVEERTPDGFIVGEYGVVSHDDGSLRGVRYTADGATNPKLIYETLIKFLSL